MPLVEAIAADGAFRSADAVRAKARTPIEKVVAILQATGTTGVDLGKVRLGAARSARGGSIATALRTMSSLPFLPPNVGGYPKGRACSDRAT